MKKHIMMAAVAASFMLAGCGSGADDEAVTVTVTASANVRDAATAEGSRVLETLSVGTELTGRWVESEANASEQWFEYERDGEKAYVWGRNLSVKPDESTGDDQSDYSDSYSTPQIRTAWEMGESRDEFTDELSRWYYAPRISGVGDLQLACTKNNEINLYFNFPEREIAYGMGGASAQIRIDSEQPYEESWSTHYTWGQSWPENTKSFLNKLDGKSKLAIEKFAAGRAVFNITGTTEAVQGLISAGCTMPTE